MVCDKVVCDKVVCDKVVCERWCGTKLCIKDGVRRRRGKRRRRPGGLQNQKQEPYTKMWGTKNYWLAAKSELFQL